MNLIIKIRRDALDPDKFLIEERNEDTGEIREIKRPTIESAFRTLGRYHDSDLRVERQ